MGKCSGLPNEQKFFFSLPSGLNCVLYAHEDRNEDGEPVSVVRIERKDGKQLSPAEHEQARRFVTTKRDEFRSFVLDVFQNWGLGINELKFSRKWFDNARQNALIILNARGLADPLTHKPVKPAALKSMKRIASVILKRAERGNKALKTGNQSSANRAGSDIVHLFWRMLSEPDRIRGRDLARFEAQGGATRSNKAQWSEWRRRADEIWAEEPHLSKRLVAKRIDEKHEEAIRKVIRHPSPSRSR